MSPRSRRPYERTRLSKLVRAALVQGGLDDLSLRDLRLDYDTGWRREPGAGRCPAPGAPSPGMR